MESSNGLTPLHLASHYNQPYMAQVLLSRKANPHASARVAACCCWDVGVWLLLLLGCFVLVFAVLGFLLFHFLRIVGVLESFGIFGVIRLSRLWAVCCMLGVEMALMLSVGTEGGWY